WGILFSHPRDFTPVCTTELGRAAKLAPEFSKRNVKMIALSIDSVQDHLSWCKVRALGRPQGQLVLLPRSKGCRRCPCRLGGTCVTSQSVAVLEFRAGVGKVFSIFVEHPTKSRVFVFGPDKKLKLSILYPATTGRNFDEILRVVDSLQLTAYKKVATPVDWKPGDSVMVLPTLPDEEAKKLFPKGVFTKELPSGKKYLRYTPQP
ncbi:PRDX6 protein, partial [Ploceus nigricollis]|nr:PRDX6 protein [Ploceus nigricollis]